MIKFNHNNIRVEFRKVKSVTTAYGGSVRVLNELASISKGKEVTDRIEVGLELARAFQQFYKASNFLHPADLAIAYYGDTVVALLKRVQRMYATDQEWYAVKDQVVKNVEQLMAEKINPTSGNTDWFVDGKQIYPMPKDTNKWLNSLPIEVLTKDGKFRAKPVDSYKMGLLFTTSFIRPVTRYVVSYTTRDGKPHFSPPIWSDVSSLGVRQFERSGDKLTQGKGRNKVEMAEAKMEPFERIEKFLSVNLNFILYAANVISETHGYEAIAPLQLPKLMIKLNTVNLPNVPLPVKDTFDVGLTFSHAITWLIGLSENTKDLTQYMKIRGTMKYLLSKGIFRNTIFKHDQVFNRNADLSQVLMVSGDEALRRGRLARIPSQYLKSLSKAKRKAYSADVGGELADQEEDEMDNAAEEPRDDEIRDKDRELNTWTTQPEFGSSN